jgi:hypothetical protein
LQSGFRRSARAGALSAVYYDESDSEDDSSWEKEQSVSEVEERINVFQWSALKHAARSGGGKAPLENLL